MAEVKSLGTRECEELRIARIVQVCYGIPGNPEEGIDEGLEHTTDSLHDSLKAFGLSKREVAAVIWLLDSEDGSGSDEYQARGGARLYSTHRTPLRCWARRLVANLVHTSIYV